MQDRHSYPTSRLRRVLASVGGAVLFLGLLFSCIFLARPVAAAEKILTGKVLSTVMRSEPMPFHAIIDDVCV